MEVCGVKYSDSLAGVPLGSPSGVLSGRVKEERLVGVRGLDEADFVRDKGCDLCSPSGVLSGRVKEERLAGVRGLDEADFVRVKGCDLVLGLFCGVFTPDEEADSRLELRGDRGVRSPVE